jgi:alpha-glucosidase
MYLLNKYCHPLNFRFADGREGGRLSMPDDRFDLHIESTKEDIYHIEVRNADRWPRDVRCETPVFSNGRPWEAGTAAGGRTRLTVDETGGMGLARESGEALLTAEPSGWFGVSGPAWLFQFRRTPEMRFFGLGEKQSPYERSGRAFRFWNVDVWADLPMMDVAHGDYDPDYLSVPYLIIQQGDTFIGLLSDTPWPGVIATSMEAQVTQGLDIELAYPPAIVLGAENGIPSLYCIYGPTLAELTRKLQRLIGTTPLPPLWALGYHQSRWGYRSRKDLEALADRFEEHKFPADGLWLDIDYMDGFRVFTFDRDSLPDPAGTAAKLKERGFRIVPILDPGVKRDPGYGVYESGRDRGVFCRNPAGTEFVGIVWPGWTVFPDFSLAETRKWWAGYAETFFATGFDGAWIDMNDPSTGPVDPMAMRFEAGKSDHAAFHNQYALLMARATRKGLEEAHPDQRPFLLSRSGCTGSQKYAAHWTGDNFSNYHHLRRAIGKSLNLAMSGFPFNGPDVGGFGGHCAEALLIDWVKAACLFPFFRNHTMQGSRDQEPWAYSPEALKLIRRFVRLRYRLLPYLYNLFMEQEETGEAILRPLGYDFPDEARVLSGIDDQFMVGPWIMQAPFLEEDGGEREVVLPQGRWFRADAGGWIEGGRRITVKRRTETTPLFFREGALIPFQPGDIKDNRKELNRIGLLCCIPPDYQGESRWRYSADDGLSLDYRKGGRTTVELAVYLQKRGLHATARRLAGGYGAVEMTICTPDRFPSVVMEDGEEKRILHPVEEPVRLAGDRFTWHRWASSPETA